MLSRNSDLIPSLLFAAGFLCASAGAAAPVLLSPASNAVNVGASATLRMAVPASTVGPCTVRFYGRVAVNPGPDFTIAALPDTQNYSAVQHGSVLGMFTAQTDWIVANHTASNIVYVAGLGDIVDAGDTNDGFNNIAQWYNATNALYRLENPVTTGLPEGIPYGTAVGNHDQSPNGDPDGTTIYFNRFFGVSHFAGRSYYGGHYGTNNNNHYDLFSASGLDFIVIYFQYDENANQDVLDWAAHLLQSYPNRRAIVVTHYVGNADIPCDFGWQAQCIYTTLRTNANFFLMLGGHIMGEGARADVFNGNSVASLVADFQGYTNGGDGFLRLMRFSPSDNLIQVSTYSPWLGQYMNDEQSQFSVPYDMAPAVAAAVTNFIALGTNSNIAAGAETSLVWSGLVPNHVYEWYVAVTDQANNTVVSPVWRFTSARKTAFYGVSAGALSITQSAAAGDVNTNCQGSVAMGINGFKLPSCNRGDYNVQVGWSASDDPALGVLISSVTQNTRNNFGSNIYCSSGITANDDGSWRIVSFLCPNGDVGDGTEENVNVAGAWFPYDHWIGGWVRNDAGINGGAWNLFTGSTNLVLGTHVVPLANGKCAIDLTSLGIDSRTDGVLLVNHAKDEANYALSQANTDDGTWTVYVHDNSTDGARYEQDPFAFVFIPRTNTFFVSGRFLGDGSISMFNGSSPRFSITNLGTGQWGLKIDGFTPAKGVLILSPEGGATANCDNIVTYETNAAGDGWIIESRDLPACGLETPGAEPVASFVFIPALASGSAALTVIPSQNLLTSRNGGTATFSVVLDSQPTASVVVTPASSDLMQGTVSPASLTFTTNNWDVAQTVTVTGVSNGLPAGDVSYSIICSVSSLDPNYAEVEPVTISAVNLDEEGIAWAGTTASPNWDVGVSTNWLNGAVLVPYANNKVVNFDDRAACLSPTLAAAVQPAAVVVNTAGTYLFSGSGSIGGNAGLVKRGTGTLIIKTTNSFTGPVVITNGILRLGAPGALGAASTNCVFATNQGTLDLNDIAAGPKTIAIAGAGCNGLGALYDSSTVNSIHYLVTNLVLLGDATIGCAGRWDFAAQGGSLVGNGYALTKTGSGSIYLSPSSAMGLGDIHILAGNLTFRTVVDMGDPNKTATVESGAILGLYGNSSKLNKIVVLNTNATLQSGLTSGQSTNNFYGPIILRGTSTLYANTSDLYLWNGLNGTGGFKKTGASVLYLNGTNTYIGPTYINVGNVVLGANSSLGGSSFIQVSNACTLNISAPASVSLGFNQTLRGSGTVLGGNLILDSGATLAPGYSGSTTGQLTITGNLRLLTDSGCLFRVNKSATMGNDRVVGLNSVTFGGYLVLDIIGNDLAVGDAITLFKATNYSGAFEAIVPDTPGDGLSWNTNTLAADGTLRVVAGVNTSRTNLVCTLANKQLTLSWPADHIGWRLQVQTNAATVGLSTNWFDVVGSTATNRVIVPINTSNSCVFYRLAY